MLCYEYRMQRTPPALLVFASPARQQEQPLGDTRQGTREYVVDTLTPTRYTLLLHSLGAQRTLPGRISLARRTYAYVRNELLIGPPTKPNTKLKRHTYPLGYELLLGRAFGLEHVLPTRNSIRSCGCLEGPRAAVCASLARLGA